MADIEQSGSAPKLWNELISTVDGLEVSIVDCSAEGGAWSGPELADEPSLVIVRRGAFARRTGGDESLIDPTMAYFQRPGVEEEFAHPVDGGDECLSISGREFFDALGLSPDDLPAGAIPTDASLCLAHRLLARRASLGDDGFEVYERAANLVSAVLDVRREPGHREAGRPATARWRRRVVGDAKQALLSEPPMGLAALSRRVASSPHHLSRVFHEESGQTLSEYRNRLRTALVLERLDQGESDLTTLAADLGFADHAHMTRVVGGRLGQPPSRLRALLVGAK